MKRLFGDLFSRSSREPAPAEFPRLDSDEALEAAHQASFDGPIVLFKHSLTCPVSGSARRRMVTFASSSPSPIYEIVVQSDRAISNKVSLNYGVHHESPQVIILQNGASVFDTSHSRITGDAILNALTPQENA